MGGLHSSAYVTEVITEAPPPGGRQRAAAGGLRHRQLPVPRQRWLRLAGLASRKQAGAVSGRARGQQGGHLIGHACHGQVDQVGCVLGVGQPHQRLGDRKVSADTVAV
jgi:hypothetical protein